LQRGLGLQPPPNRLLAVFQDAQAVECVVVALAIHDLLCFISQMQKTITISLPDQIVADALELLVVHRSIP